MGNHTNKYTKLTFGNIIRRGTALTLGAVIMAYGLESLLIPNNIIDGGVTGISMLLNHTTPLV